MGRSQTQGEEHMTDDRIKAVFEEYGRIVTGKEYALIHAIAEAVAPQRTFQEPVGTVKELFTQAATERLDLRGSTKVYTSPHSFFEDVANELRVEIAELQDHIRLLEKQLTHPLTEAQAAEVWPFVWRGHEAIGHMTIVRAIEAAHGIKEKNT